MENFNWLVTEMMVKDAVHRSGARQRSQPVPPNESREYVSGIKRMLATTFVRLGLRLDPALGEGLGAFGLTLRPHERPRP